MRSALLLPAALLLLGCQHQPDPQLTAELDRLQHLERVQADSLRALRHQLTGAQLELASIATVLNFVDSDDSARAAEAKAHPERIPPGTLYAKPAVVDLHNEELATILSDTDSTTSNGTAIFAATAYLVCNGPSDLTVDIDNCSHYVYLALGAYEMPHYYKVFRLGPFYEAEFGGWQKDPKDDERLLLRIRHDIKGRPRTDTFRIGLDKVQLL